MWTKQRRWIASPDDFVVATTMSLLWHAAMDRVVVVEDSVDTNLRKSRSATDLFGCCVGLGTPTMIRPSTP